MKAQCTEVARGPVSVTGSCCGFKPRSWGGGDSFQNPLSPRRAVLQNDEHSSQRAQPIVLCCCAVLVACEVLQGREKSFLMIAGPLESPWMAQVWKEFPLCHGCVSVGGQAVLTPAPRRASASGASLQECHGAGTGPSLTRILLQTRQWELGIFLHKRIPEAGFLFLLEIARAAFVTHLRALGLFGENPEFFS